MQAAHVVQPEGLGCLQCYEGVKHPLFTYTYTIHCVCVTNVVPNNTIWFRLEGENPEATLEFIFKREIEKCPHLIFLFVYHVKKTFCFMITSEPTNEGVLKIFYITPPSM